VTTISKSEFERLCSQIEKDREIIIRNNPIGAPEEILLWMLLGVLVSYLSLSEVDTPCFNGKPDAGTYRDAIRFVLNGRMENNFDPDEFLAGLA
jgi:hypothetical protein